MFYNELMASRCPKKLHHKFKTQLKTNYPHIFYNYQFKNPIKALASCINWNPCHTQTDSVLEQKINVLNTHLCSDTNHVFLYVGDTTASDEHEATIKDDEHVYHIVCDKFELLPYIHDDQNTGSVLPISTANIMAHAFQDCLLAVTPDATISSLFFSSNDAWEHKTVDNLLGVQTFVNMARGSMTDYQLIVYSDNMNQSMAVIAALQKNTHRLHCFARILDSSFDNDHADDDDEYSTGAATEFEFVTQTGALAPGFFMFQKDTSIMFVYKSTATALDAPGIVVKELKFPHTTHQLNESATLNPVPTFGCKQSLNTMCFQKKLCQLVCGFLFMVDPATGFIFRGEFQRDGVFWTEHRDLLSPKFNMSNALIFATSNINGKLVVMEEKRHYSVFEPNTVITTHFLTVMPSNVDISYFGHFMTYDSINSVAYAFKDTIMPVYKSYVKKIDALSIRVLDHEGNLIENDPDGGDPEWISDLEFRVDIYVKRFIDDESLTTTTITFQTSYCTDEFAVLFNATASGDIEQDLGFNLPQHITNRAIYADDSSSNYLKIHIASDAGGAKRCSVAFEGAPGRVFWADVV